MSHIRRFDHVGITVADLDTVTAFFVGLGLEVEGNRMVVEGEFLDVEGAGGQVHSLTVASIAGCWCPDRRSASEMARESSWNLDGPRVLAGRRSQSAWQR